jgi:hypothetical protein
VKSVEGWTQISVTSKSNEINELRDVMDLSVSPDGSSCQSLIVVSLTNEIPGISRGHT